MNLRVGVNECIHYFICRWRGAVGRVTGGLDINPAENRRGSSHVGRDLESKFTLLLCGGTEGKL